MSSHAQSNIDAQGLPIGYLFKPEWEVLPRQVRAALQISGSDPVQNRSVHHQPRLDRFTLLDCRRIEEFHAAKIDGAVLIPLSELANRADELEGNDGNRTETIVVYCHHGRRSMQAATMLRAMGFMNTYSMAGGIDLWSVDIDPTVPRY